VPEFTKTTADQLKSEIASLTKSGATKVILDLRGTAFGELDFGLAASKLFVKTGVLMYRQDRGKEKEAVSAVAGDGTITTPLALLADNGTSGAAEVFAAALAGNKRATIVGEHTLGRAARQKFVRLPDGSGLLLTHLVYMTPAGISINEKGLTPEVGVAQPDVDFGQVPPTKDPILDKAVETLTKPAQG
jgi:carboxyl-terminal processing protease